MSGQEASGAIRGTGSLTFHQSTYEGGPGVQQSYLEFDTTDLSVGGSYQTLYVDSFQLNVVPTTLLL